MYRAFSRAYFVLWSGLTPSVSPLQAWRIAFTLSLQSRAAETWRRERLLEAALEVTCTELARKFYASLTITKITLQCQCQVSAYQ
jgi:hypothetical protein